MSTAAPPDFVVYAEGLCYASVCTSLSDEAATVRMFPSGTSQGWRISSDEQFVDGTPNRAPCPQHPGTHRHLLFEC